MKYITPSFYVAEQLSLADLEILSEQGIQHVICNRPDNEGEGQIQSETISAAAQNLGMSFHLLPVLPGQFSDESIAEFGRLVKGLDGKVLAYCRTGTRSLSLWTLSNPEQKSRSELLSLAESAGYNMSGLVDRVAE